MVLPLFDLVTVARSKRLINQHYLGKARAVMLPVYDKRCLATETK